MRKRAPGAISATLVLWWTGMRTLRAGRCANVGPPAEAARLGPLDRVRWKAIQERAVAQSATGKHRARTSGNHPIGWSKPPTRSYM